MRGTSTNCRRSPLQRNSGIQLGHLDTKFKRDACGHFDVAVLGKSVHSVRAWRANRFALTLSIAEMCK